MKNNSIKLLGMAALALGALVMQSFTTQTIKEEKMKNKEKVITITKTGEVINVSAEDLWKIVGDDFANVGKWATSVDHSVGTGTPEYNGATCSERGCELNAKGFSSIKEKLTQYDAENRELTYEVFNGFPGFVTKAANHWTVKEVGPNQSQLVMEVTMKMKPFMGALMGGMMKKNINSLLPVVHNDLKVYAETGEISESKAARIASLN